MDPRGVRKSGAEPKVAASHLRDTCDDARIWVFCGGGWIAAGRDAICDEPEWDSPASRREQRGGDDSQYWAFDSLPDFSDLDHSVHPVCGRQFNWLAGRDASARNRGDPVLRPRSEEHTSELQSRGHLVCRLLLEKKRTRCSQDR